MKELPFDVITKIYMFMSPSMYYSASLVWRGFNVSYLWKAFWTEFLLHIHFQQVFYFILDGDFVYDVLINSNRWRYGHQIPRVEDLHKYPKMAYYLLLNEYIAAWFYYTKAFYGLVNSTRLLGSISNDYLCLALYWIPRHDLILREN